MRAESGPRVRLVCMPWASATRPSLGIGLLVAAARARGFDCRAEYANLEFAAAYGAEAYELFASHDVLFALGEHLFAVDLFGRTALQSDRFLARFLSRHANGNGHRGVSLSEASLYAARDVLVPDALDRLAERILDAQPDIVGLSCVFNQVLPSLALARRLKAARPELRILLGGACVHGKMGETYAAAFPEWVDHVFTGEADHSFPALLETLTRGGDPRRLAGVTSAGRLYAPPPLVRELDALPVPDYDDYFEARGELASSGGGQRLLERYDLAFESSRGCWWGQKSHCTFCGLNNQGMSYRMKSPERVIAEVSELATRYHCLDLEAADNILPYAAYRSLLPRLAELRLDLRFLYEIKANIGRDDAAALAAAGIRWVQPGVESFSDHVLALMRKGSTGAQNIQLLKWLQEFGVTPYYNLLVGFPGETAADYEAMLELLPALFHLTPPVRSQSLLVSVHRFAPFFNEPERWGIQGMQPAWYYRHLIPPARAASADFAFFFDRKIPRNAPVHRQRPRLDQLLARWARSRRTLKASLGPGFISILRGNGGRETEAAKLTGEAATVFLLCDAQTSLPGLTRDFGALHPGAESRLPLLLAELLRRKLVVQCGERLVGVVPFERPHQGADLVQWLERWVDGRTGQPSVGGVVNLPRSPVA